MLKFLLNLVNAEGMGIKRAIRHCFLFFLKKAAQIDRLSSKGLLCRIWGDLLKEIEYHAYKYVVSSV